MTGQLMHHDSDSFVRCYLCGEDAAGPCMRCRRSVCGDCCVLVGGAAQTWAVCTACEHKSGKKVDGWGSLGLFFLKLLMGILALILLLAWLQSPGS